MRAFRVLQRTALGVVAGLVLTATGLGYWQAHGLLGGITISQALGLDAPRSSGDAMNVLLIGLDSRKDQNGNDLPDEILDKLHAGDSSTGGYNTNTLILVHISAEGRVTAFSIPRDDFVAVNGIDGHDHIKIKEAYGLTKGQTEDELHDEGITDASELERRSREAGRKATLRAVRNLTGEPIDYFAEVNLAGFYDIAESLGGVQVCLNHAVSDDYSGADFPAGRQTLDAAQALAFVRQRHGLPNGDLDRTHRQQAFLLSVMHELQTSGALSDLGKFRALMDVARRDLVLSRGWDEQQFHRMAALAGGDVTFQTLPVVRYDTVNGQDVNIIDPAAIRATIAAAIKGSPTTTTTTTPTPKPSHVTAIAVINATDVTGLAAQAAAILAGKGYSVAEPRDRQEGEPLDTGVGYGPGTETEANALAVLLGIPSPPQADATLPAGQIRITLGPGYQISGASMDSVTDTHTPTSTVDTLSGLPSTPKPEVGAPIAAGGIPCVN